jgi:DNA-binding NarL/FixJ family response regulator
MQALTEREQQVLTLICGGFSTKEIAAELKIAFKTAACHRSRVLGKAGVHNSTSLLRWSIKYGFVEIDLPDERLGTAAKAGSA